MNRLKLFIRNKMTRNLILLNFKFIISIANVLKLVLLLKVNKGDYLTTE